MGRGGRILRAQFGAAKFWGVIRFMYVGILPSHATTLMASIRVPSAGAFKHLKLSGGESHLVRHDMDLNYVSKRRVPNGPDPIHNRRDHRCGATIATRDHK
ncbi:clavata3/esr-related family protein [Salix suchowensis]|nr:clavata3/esr-related family protein [Salix suchowensis]